MAGLWNDVSIAEELATAGTGAANALYFASRTLRSGGPRRVAALVLVALFAGAALEAGVPLVLGEAGPLAAALRLPVLFANLATFALIFRGAGR